MSKEPEVCNISIFRDGFYITHMSSEPVDPGWAKRAGVQFVARPSGGPRDEPSPRDTGDRHDV